LGDYRLLYEHDPEQIDYLSVLKMGCAAVYSEGDTRPKLVKLPLVAKTNRRTRRKLIQRSREAMQAVYQEDKSIYRMSPACTFCKEQCQHYAMVQGWFGEGKIKKDEIDKIIEKINELFKQGK
jgi:hypothetical protein